MNRARGLGRQLALSMASVAMAMLLLTIIGFYAVYTIILAIDPSFLPPSAQVAPVGADGFILIGVCLLGLAFAIFSAVRLARRILQPLHAVAGAARRIAAGDLAARAVRGERQIGETGMLVDDFNVMAERLDRMAKDMIVWNATIAHELRTPLTILRGRLQGIADGVFQADEATIRRLLGHVDALARLVEDLRVVSLVDSGHMPLEPARVDLVAEIEELATLVRPELQKAGFQLSLNLASGLAQLDRARLQQALLALLDNATHHADPCTLRIDLKRTGETVAISVVDQGPGMSTDFAGQAFGLFTRGEIAREKTRGTGLGLSVVRAIARAHGGDVRYERSGRDCAFVMTFPGGLPVAAQTHSGYGAAAEPPSNIYRMKDEQR